IAEARRRADALGIGNVELLVRDAEGAGYEDLAPALVTAHLCMSDAIAGRAARALVPGGLFATVAFHTDQWKETGRPSRFAYDEARMRRVLEGHGLAVEHLEVEREVATFGSVEEALAAAIGLQEKWQADGRWFRYIKFLEDGGRTLTRGGGGGDALRARAGRRREGPGAGARLRRRRLRPGACRARRGVRALARRRPRGRHGVPRPHARGARRPRAPAARRPLGRRRRPGLRAGGGGRRRSPVARRLPLRPGPRLPRRHASP